MNRHSGLALVAAAALAVGVALAQPSGPQAAAPQDPTPIDRLGHLEKQVAELTAQVEALRKAQPRAGAPAAAGEADKQTAELREQMDQVLAYLGAQAQSAAQLQTALDESRDKGFTYGINPDSRVVLLEGFGQLATSLQSDVPQAKKKTETTAATRR